MSRERMNSSPEYAGGPGHGQYRPRLRRRTMSIENTSLTEVITIYEKLKKTRDHDGDVFQPSSVQFGFDIDESDFEESVPMEPFTASDASVSVSDIIMGSQKVLNFNRYKELKGSKYLYFSSLTELIQSPTIEGLKWVGSSSDSFDQPQELNYVKLLKSKQYWLNIIDPSEKDLLLLSSAFNVHDLTLRDIREGNTEEKMEVYKHYMFISLRLLTENDTTSHKKSKRSGGHANACADPCKIHNENCSHNNDSVFLRMDDDEDNRSIVSTSTSDEKDPVPFAEDVDFNILLFSDFVITIHDKPWNSIKDVLGFLNLMCTYGNSVLTPDWVLFSIFIELAQDAKYSVAFMEPKILNVKIAGTDSENASMGGEELGKILRKNFEYEFEIYKITRFVKPKMNILKMLKLKCQKRLSSTVIKLLSNTCSEFEELLDEINHFSHILERSQDTFLTMASVQQSIEANDMGKVMKRISEVALIFLPVTAISGFLGMNVKVPFQDAGSTWPFWSIVILSLLAAFMMYFYRIFKLNKRSFKLKCFSCKKR